MKVSEVINRYTNIVSPEEIATITSHINEAFAGQYIFNRANTFADNANTVEWSILRTETSDNCNETIYRITNKEGDTEMFYISEVVEDYMTVSLYGALM